MNFKVAANSAYTTNALKNTKSGHLYIIKYISIVLLRYFCSKVYKTLIKQKRLDYNVSALVTNGKMDILQICRSKHFNY